MDWGSFAGGVSQGMDQGSLIKQRQQAAALAALQQQALAARGKEGLAGADALAAGGAPPAAPPQGAAPPPGGPPAAMPMFGATPMPPGVGGAPAGPPPGPAPMPQGGAPQPPPQGAPGPAAPPPSPPPAQPGGSPAAPAGGAPLSGVAKPTGNFQQDIGNSVHAMYASLLKADPSLKSNPKAAALAVDQMIDQAKGFDESTRTAMTSANELFKAQISLQEVQTRTQATLRKAAEDRAAKSADIMVKNKASEYGADKGLEGREYAADRGVEGREYAADRGVDKGEYAADRGVDKGEYGADKGLEGREYAADRGVDKGEYAADTGEEGRIYAAQAGNANPGNAPAPPPSRVRKPGVPATPGSGGKAKPIPASTMAQWAKVPAANKAAAKKHLQDQGYDTSGLN